MKVRDKIGKVDKDFVEVIWNRLVSSKNYEGSLLNRGFSSYCFYDEQEVKYIPTLEIIKENKTKSFLKKEYENYKHKIEEETGVKATIIPKVYIDFKLSEIEFILLAKREYIQQITSLLEVDWHSIKFLTYEQISKDILGLSHSMLKIKFT